MSLRSIAAIVAAAVIVGVFSSNSYAITWCFDWVAYKVGKKDINQQNAKTLRDLLEKEGYEPVLEVRAKTRSAKPGPEDIKLEIERVAPPALKLDERLRPGDVLIFGKAHTGIVRTRRGRVDHFLQIPGKTGTRYTPKEAAQSENYFVGRRSWTLEELFAFSREEAPETYGDVLSLKTWKAWLGNFFKPGRQYPFLHSTATVWRRIKEAPSPTPGPTPGPTPAPTPAPTEGRTATKLRLTLTGSGGEAWAERDLKTEAVQASPADPTVTAPNGSSVSGSATLAGGSLGPGEILYVYASYKTATSGETKVLCQEAGSCTFTMPTNPPGRAAREVAVAYICKGVPMPGFDTCYHQFDLRVDVLWTE